MVSQPQFLLFCDTHASDAPSSAVVGAGSSCFGRWHFVLDRLDRPEHLEAADSESAIHPDRLALLSVVRGLEALDEPSRVNLVTTSRYVSRGLKYGLSNWRESGYQWERFGIQKPIRNADLWQRVDRALKFHGVTCRLIQSAAAPVEMVAEESVAGEMESVAAANGLTPHAASVDLWQPAAAVGTAGASLNRVSVPPEARLNAPVLNRTYQVERGLHLWQLLGMFSVNWWGLAIAWIKWWRGRYQHRPLYLGT